MCALCDDPIPAPLAGQPERVSDYARAFDDTAEALRDAARELRKLANENLTIGESIEEVRQRAEEGHADASKVAVRYQGASNTYSAYASSLSAAQSKANSARTNIDTNNHNGRYWRHRQREMEQDRWLHNADPEFLADLAEATRKATHYDSQYAQYLATYQVAVDERDAAVRNAIAGLAAAAEAAGLNDGFFESMLGDLQNAWDLASKYLGPVLEALREVLKVLKQIVDFLALIVTILSIVFPALAPLALALTALSAILAIGIFLCSLVLFAMGRETLGTVIADGIMAVVGVVTAKLGGAGNLFGATKAGFQSLGQAPHLLFVTRSVYIANGMTVGGAAVQSYGAAGGEMFEEAVKAGYLSSFATPFSFVAGEGLDFTIGAHHDAWGADPVWSMDGANGSDVIPGVLDGPTLGAAGPLSGIAGIGDGFADIGEAFAGIGSEWGSITTVPAN